MLPRTGTPTPLLSELSRAMTSVLYFFSTMPIDLVSRAYVISGMVFTSREIAVASWTLIVVKVLVLRDRSIALSMAAVVRSAGCGVVDPRERLMLACTHLTRVATGWMVNKI